MNKRTCIPHAVAKVCAIMLLFLAFSATQAQADISIEEVWQYEHIISDTTPNVDPRFNLEDFAVSLDGRRIALGYRDNTQQIDIVDAQTGDLLQVLEVPTPLEIIDMEWDHSGERLAVGIPSEILIWNFVPNSDPRLGRIGNVQTPRFSWSSDGQLAIASQDISTETGFLDATLRIVDIVTVGEVERLFVSGVFSPVWSPDGRYIALLRYNVFSDEDINQPLFLDVLDTQTDLRVTVQFSDDISSVLAPSGPVVWLPDSSALMGFTTEGELWRWLVGSTMIEIVRPDPVEDSNRGDSLAINARGDLLAVSNEETEFRVEIWDAETGESLLQLPTSESVLFEWGADDILYVYDSILYAYQVNRAS